MKVKYTMLILALLLIQSGYGQSETRSLAGFDRVSVGQSIELILIPGDRNEAQVEVSGSIELREVLTEVSGSRLRISLDDRRGGYRNVDVRVELTFEELEGVKASSSSDVIGRGIISGEQLEIEVSSSADLEVEVDVDELEVRVSSSGDCEVSGRAMRQDIRVSSSGEYSGYDLESEYARVDVSSSGEAKIFVTEELDAEASSSGRVTYKGDPDKVWSDSSSSGRVRKY